MNSITNRLQEIARQAACNRPDLQGEILDAMQLAASEIEGGASPEHELELFQQHINQLQGDP